LHLIPRGSASGLFIINLHKPKINSLYSITNDFHHIKCLLNQDKYHDLRGIISYSDYY